MNGQHVRTIVWLRWRLMLARMRRGSSIGAVFAAMLVFAGITSGLAAFVLSWVVGAILLVDAGPDVVLLVWDGLVAAFLFFWVIGVVTELQRSEPLSLEKLLHLPISLRSAFVLNYTSSFLSFALIIFGSAMAGLTVALVTVKGPIMLALVPLVVTFVFMVTALTYQFRGWLASLMVNKRRRGSVIALVTLSVILLAQLPQLLNVFYQRRVGSDFRSHSAAIEDLDRKRRAGTLPAEEASEQITRLNETFYRERQGRKAESAERAMNAAVVVNVALPVGWLPYGARSAVERRFWPVVFGSAGAMLIGLLSLGRSYRTTLRIYTSGFEPRRSRKKKTPAKPAAPSQRDAAKLAFFERTLPGCSERVSAVALMSFRAFSRAPQAKLVLLTPIVLLVIFGSMMFSGRRATMPEFVTPLLGLGAAAMTVVFLAQLIQNVFGFDRDGFRAFILTPVPRDEVLLGKNLAIAPFAFVIGGVGLTLLQLTFPQPVPHLLASILQLACVYVICCMFGNVTSILAPIAMSPNTLKPANPKAITILKQMVFLFLMPLAILPSAVLLGVELLLERMQRGMGVPIYLILSLVEIAAVLWLYKRVLRAEGRLLQRHEQRILEEVTSSLD